MLKRIVIQEIRAMLERNWTELEIAHKLCISQADVHTIVLQYFS